jgi:hypothetical protein
MSPTALYRLAALSGLACGVQLLFNDARRVGLVPETALTEGVAPLAAVLGVFGLTGLYLYQRERAGVLGLAGYALNVAGLAGLFAVDFTLHYVFALLDDATVDRLLDGRTGVGFLLIGLTYLAGILLFGVASWRARVLPAPAVALYVLGFIPATLRASLNEHVVSAGLLVGACGVLWLSASLWRTTARTRVEAR